MRRFDQKFGPDLLETVPSAPGVYRFYDREGVVVYVGKSVNLRRRLGQYRATTRARRHKKARVIVKDAVAIDWEVLPSELDACVAEVRLIQSLRPRHNVASAFEFLYPLVGLKRHGHTLRLCTTNTPARFGDYSLHGSYRSREVTRDAFFALARLLRRVGHPEPRTRLDGDDRRDPHSWVFGFRRLPESYLTTWDSFFRGEDDSVLGRVACRLLDQASARAQAAEVESDLRALATFFAEEASPLRHAVRELGFTQWPVPQTERDPLFVRYRLGPQHPSDAAAISAGRTG